jgi:predicted transcriptional regulator
MVDEQERLKEAILDMVSVAPERRLRPHELGKALSHELEILRRAVQEAVKNLVQEGHLTFTYHDPTSYVEVPEPASWLGVPY